MQRFKLGQSLGDFKVVKVSKRGKIRTDYITTVDGLGELVVRFMLIEKANIS